MLLTLGIAGCGGESTDEAAPSTSASGPEQTRPNASGLEAIDPTDTTEAAPDGSAANSSATTPTTTTTSVAGDGPDLPEGADPGFAAPTIGRVGDGPTTTSGAGQTQLTIAPPPAEGDPPPDLAPARPDDSVVAALPLPDEAIDRGPDPASVQKGEFDDVNESGEPVELDRSALLACGHLEVALTELDEGDEATAASRLTDASRAAGESSTPAAADLSAIIDAARSSGDGSDLFSGLRLCTQFGYEV